MLGTALFTGNILLQTGVTIGCTLRHHQRQPGVQLRALFDVLNTPKDKRQRVPDAMAKFLNLEAGYQWAMLKPLGAKTQNTPQV